MKNFFYHNIFVEKVNCLILTFTKKSHILEDNFKGIKREEKHCYDLNSLLYQKDDWQT